MESREQWLQRVHAAFASMRPKAELTEEQRAQLYQMPMRFIDINPQVHAQMGPTPPQEGQYTVMDIPKQVEVSGWINVFYPFYVAPTLYPTKEEADAASEADQIIRLACVFVEGQAQPEVSYQGSAT